MLYWHIRTARTNNPEQMCAVIIFGGIVNVFVLLCVCISGIVGMMANPVPRQIYVRVNILIVL